MDMKRLNRQEIHERLFDILCVFDAYCKEHGISYYLCGGTMLGAIRHQDFIPWDDDVDVMLLRPEYRKLESCLKQYPLPDFYEYLSSGFGNSVLPFAKIVNTNIIVEEKVNATDRHLWIDIFPIDAIPEDEKTCRLFLQRAKKLAYAHSMSNAPIGTGTTLVRAVLKLPVLLYRHAVVLCKGKQFYARQIEEMCVRYDYESSRYVGTVSWCAGEAERFLKESFEPAQEANFGSRQFPIPANWQTYLTQLYGDYKELPPESQRQGHRYIAYEKN